MQNRKRTAVVALDFRPRHNPLEFYRITHLPFEEQLKIFCDKIESACAVLSDTNPVADEWIISWREYGLCDGESRYINVEQRAKLKEAMKALTQKHEKLTIISGTVASKRAISSVSFDEREADFSKIKEAYGENISLQKDRSYQSHFEGAHKNINSAQSADLGTVPVSIVRNTSYVFRGGKLIARHDKTAPFAELRGLNETEHLFRPGRQKSHPSVIDEKIAIEICREHAVGVLTNQLSSRNQTAPDMQFVLSASIDLSPWHIACPYLIHIDSKNQVSLITEKDPGEITVSVYRLDMIDTENALKIVNPRTIKQSVIANLEMNIAQNYAPLLDELLNHDFLDVHDIEKFLMSLIALSLNKDSMQIYGDKPLSRNTVIRFNQEEMLKYVRSRQLNLDPRINLLCLAAYGKSAEVEQAALTLDLSQPHPCDKTLFLIAATKGHATLLNKLLERGDIDINSELNPGRKTALYLAGLNMRADTIKQLIEKGALLDSSDFLSNQVDNSRGAYAVIAKVVEMNPQLINKPLTFKYETLLHLAVMMGDVSLVTRLIAKGESDINAKNSAGLTPIHYAILRGDLEIYRLLQAGSNLSLYKAVEFAKRCGPNNEVAKAILSEYDHQLPLYYEKLNLLHKALLESQPTPLSSHLATIAAVVENRHNQEPLFRLLAACDAVKRNPQLFSETNISTKLLKLIKLIENDKQSPDDYKVLVTSFIGELEQTLQFKSRKLRNNP